MTHLFVKLAVIAIGSLATISSEIATGNDQFDVGTMPQGSQVTLPRAAKILSPLSVPLRLSSTDTPQTLSFVSQSTGKKQLPPIKIAIFDPRQDRVRYVDLKPGSPVLYTFRGLSTIQVVPQITPTLRTAMNLGQLRLRIESDKPVSISR